MKTDSIMLQGSIFKLRQWWEVDNFQLSRWMLFVREGTLPLIDFIIVKSDSLNVMLLDDKKVKVKMYNPPLSFRYGEQ